MQRLVVILIAFACGGRATCPPPVAARTPIDPPGVVEKPAIQKPAIALDDAAVIAMSHDFAAAYDARGAELKSKLGSGFVLFENGRTYPSSWLFDRVPGRRPARTWHHERVQRGAGIIVFVAGSVEDFPAVDTKIARKVEAWNTLVWAHEDGVWKVAYWHRQRGGMDAERDMWNEVFANEDATFNRKPNGTLVAAIKGRKAGTALDVAMGQGRNAVYMATQGWKTTGIDISDEGMRVAKALAAQQKVDITAVMADIKTWDYGKERWDLVTLIYAGSDHDVIEKMKTSLKRGGLFVIEFFGKEADQGSVANTGIGAFARGELAALFPNYKILRDDVVEDVPDWGGTNRIKVARFVAQKP